MQIRPGHSPKTKQMAVAGDKVACLVSFYRAFTCSVGLGPSKSLAKAVETWDARLFGLPCKVPDGFLYPARQL